MALRVRLLRPKGFLGKNDPGSVLPQPRPSGGQLTNRESQLECPSTPFIGSLPALDYVPLATRHFLHTAGGSLLLPLGLWAADCRGSGVGTANGPRDRTRHPVLTL